MNIEDWYEEFAAFFATKEEFERVCSDYPCEIACRAGISPRAAFEDWSDQQCINSHPNSAT